MPCRQRRAHLVAAAAVITALSACGAPAAATPPPVPQATTPTTAAEAPARPANGAVTVRPPSPGNGVLEVRNGNDRDAHVTLARGSRADLAVYVRARRTARVGGVPDGTHTVYFTTGDGWAPGPRRFTDAEYGQRFTDRLDYTTTSAGSTIWTLTLNPVPGGTARTEPVDAAGIPR